jgi:outer membrane protein TolC
MIDVAREGLAARQENARLTGNQFKEGVSLASQRDAPKAQAMKAQAGLLQASLDYLLKRDEWTRVLGASAK